MSFHQKNPQYSPDQPLQTHDETQGLEVAQESKALPSDSKEAPDAGIPSTSESPQSFCSSLIVTRVTSFSQSGEGSSSQEEEEEDSSLEAVPDPKNVPIDAVDENVASLVNFLLFKYQMKELITKAEMLKIVSKEYEGYFTEVFLRASVRMEIIFGLDVKEVDPTNHCYAILIKMGLTYDGMLHGEIGVPKTGILILILGAIFMKDNHATEEEIWEVMSVMGLYPGKKHYIFGEPRKLITKYFVEEEYLKYQKVPNSDPAQFEFLWGPRAHAETTKMQVLEFLAKVHGTVPSSFPSQYEEALQDEEERARSRISATAIDFRGHCQF
ncbi:PREDICTED: melanoma-associated antigen B16-like [Miniopterus natalensis]|uniref:melanoma-associated antigen B16-like n=1 Tax=Miniopterus natalensis TaxID=291302 RepID=UPI0007A6ED41|nr:PREDICTED: melanoma-associated antigen B16-like [Miniopterus natalensis]